MLEPAEYNDLVAFPGQILIGNTYYLFLIKYQFHLTPFDLCMALKAKLFNFGAAGVGENGRGVGAAKVDGDSGRLLQLGGRERIRHWRHVRSG